MAIEWTSPESNFGAQRFIRAFNIDSFLRFHTAWVSLDRDDPANGSRHVRYAPESD